MRQENSFRQGSILEVVLVANILVILTSSYLLFYTIKHLPVPVTVTKGPESVKTDFQEQPQSIPTIELLPPNTVIKRLPIPPNPAVLEEIESGRFILDDFSRSVNFNRLQYETGTNGKNSGICNASMSETDLILEKDTRNLSLRLDYDVSVSPMAYSDYWSKFGNMDMSKFSKVSFYIKGVTGKEILYIVLDDGQGAAKMQVFAADSWRKIAINFSSFDRALKWDKSGGLIGFLFRQIESSPLKSTIYIDSITFE